MRILSFATKVVVAGFVLLAVMPGTYLLAIILGENEEPEGSLMRLLTIFSDENTPLL
jgi:hypothetical protein